MASNRQGLKPFTLKLLYALSPFHDEASAAAARKAAEPPTSTYHVHHEGGLLARVLAICGSRAEVKHGGPRLAHNSISKQALA